MSEQVHPNREANSNWHPKAPETRSESPVVTLRPYEQTVLDNLKVKQREMKSNPEGLLTDADRDDQKLVSNAEKLFREYMRPGAVGRYEGRGFSIENMGDFLGALQDDATNQRNSLETDLVGDTTDADEAEDILRLLQRVDEKIRSIDFLRGSLKTQRRGLSTVRFDAKPPLPEEVSVLESEAKDIAAEIEVQALISRVLRAAKGSFAITTSVTTQGKLHYRGGSATAKGDGGAMFGDGVDQDRANDRIAQRGRGAFLEANDSPEALIFEPDTQPLYETVTLIEKSGLFNRARSVENEKYVGEKPIMMLNPETGQEEPRVSVRYQFDGNTGYNYNYDTRQEKGLPVYTPPDSNSRAGNYLFVEMTLPQSVADDLRQVVIDDPGAIRQLVGGTMVAHGATESIARMPPYAELPAGWTMAVTNMQKHGGRRSVVSRQDVVV